jgi:hypothetical protein
MVIQKFYSPVVVHDSAVVDCKVEAVPILVVVVVEIVYELA